MRYFNDTGNRSIETKTELKRPARAQNRGGIVVVAGGAAGAAACLVGGGGHGGGGGGGRGEGEEEVDGADGAAAQGRLQRQPRQAAQTAHGTDHEMMWSVFQSGRYQIIASSLEQIYYPLLSIVLFLVQPGSLYCMNTFS